MDNEQTAREIADKLQEQGALSDLEGAWTVAVNTVLAVLAPRESTMDKDEQTAQLNDAAEQTAYELISVIDSIIPRAMDGNVRRIRVAIQEKIQRELDAAREDEREKDLKTIAKLRRKYVKHIWGVSTLEAVDEITVAIRARSTDAKDKFDLYHNSTDAKDGESA